MTTRPRYAQQLLLGVLGVMALFAASCGGSSSTQEDVATTADAPAAEAPAAEAEESAVEESAPEEAAAASLVSETVTGGQIDFGDLEGQDVVLWFWAPW